MPEKAIPQGYMTVGQLASRLGTTVRTLQYYDREGILTPSAQSEGGRRLYTEKDVVKLHQILSMKYLGFSLDDIRTRIVALETPEDVAHALGAQAQLIEQKVEELQKVLSDIRALKKETELMRTVDFKKYADIVALLQMNNENYWIVKHFDEPMMNHIRTRFSERSGKAVFDAWDTLSDQALALIERGRAPDSAEALSWAELWWDMVMDFTGGDMSLLPHLMKFGEERALWQPHMRERQSTINGFSGAALDAYFTKLGHNPFEEVL